VALWNDPYPPAIAVQAGGDAVTVTIRGELDLASGPALSDCLAQALARHSRSLVFDLAKAGFMDCASAPLIIEAALTLPGSPPPVLRHPVFAVRRVLSVTGLDAQCTIEP
jgi:anti-anti-sigma factor